MGVVYKSEGTFWSLNTGESSIVPMCKISGEIKLLKLEGYNSLWEMKIDNGKTFNFTTAVDVDRDRDTPMLGVYSFYLGDLQEKGTKYFTFYKNLQIDHFDNTNRLFEILDENSYEENNLEICEIYQDENQSPQKSFLEQNYISILIFLVGIILGILIGIILRKMFFKRKSIEK